MKKTLMFFIAIICISLQGCADYTDDNAVPSGNNLSGGGSGNGSGGNNGGGSTTISANLPVKIYSYEAITTIEYDNQNRFAKILYLNHNGALGYYYDTYLTYSNDTLKQIKNATNFNKNEIVTIYDLTYDLDTIFIHNQRDGNIEKIAINNNNQMIYRKDRSISSSFIYDTKGRVLSTKHIESQFENTFSYDNTNGIFKNVNLPSWLKHYLANIISSIIFINCENNVKDVVTNHNSSSSLTYYYQFNSNNYPDYVGTSTNGFFEGYSYQIEYSK